MPAFDPYVHVIKPMLAESRETPFDSKDHIFELKWGGTRALAVVRDGVRFQNRRLWYGESLFPDLAGDTRKPTILVGDTVGHKEPLDGRYKHRHLRQVTGKINNQ